MALHLIILIYPDKKIEKSNQIWTVCAESEIWNLNQNLRSWVLSFNWCSKRKNYVGKISLKSTEKCEFHSAQGRNQDLNLVKKVRYQERIVAKNFIKCLIPCKNFMKWMFTRQKLYKITVYKKKWRIVSLHFQATSSTTNFSWNHFKI